MSFPPDMPRRPAPSRSPLVPHHRRRRRASPRSSPSSRSMAGTKAGAQTIREYNLEIVPPMSTTAAATSGTPGRISWPNRRQGPSRPHAHRDGRREAQDQRQEQSATRP